MPFPKEFQYNPIIAYTPSSIIWSKNLFVVSTDIMGQALTNLKIYVNTTDKFIANVEKDVFLTYTLVFYSNDLVNKWISKCDMTFYQNQLNFALYCASTGCGISKSHLFNKNYPDFIKSFFRFHLYYQIRKILHELECSLPGDELFKAADNHINVHVYDRICNEFRVDVSSDWRQKYSANQGLGTLYNYATNIGYQPVSPYVYGGLWDTKWFSFTRTPTKIHIDYIAQDSDAGWIYFIQKEGQGFTQAGISRLNDSIRTYVYCILGAQVLVRSTIIGNTGPSFDAQKQFLVLLEDSIHSSISIPDSIQKYQDAITNARVRLNFAIGPSLYLIPSDMILKINSIEGYNNNIMVASDDMSFGINDINNKTMNTFVPPMNNEDSKINRPNNRPDNKIHQEVESKQKPDKTKPGKPFEAPTLPSLPISVHHENTLFTSLGIGTIIGLLIYYYKR